ncbi:hypothetical protein C0J52_18494 [Blattella germanica]|nr:hypothetical protein C0J52_18494 [Blattella germanica]
MLSIAMRVFLVEMVFREGDKFSENVKIKFRERFPNAICPNRDAVPDLIKKFREIGSVHDAPRSGRPKLLTEAKVDEISDVILRSPSKSMRKLAQETNFSVRSAHRAVTKELNLHAYKFTVVQELKVPDHEKRLQYCRWFQSFINRHGINVLDRTFFTDEAWFSPAVHNPRPSGRMRPAGIFIVARWCNWKINYYQNTLWFLQIFRERLFVKIIISDFTSPVLV